MTRDAAPSAGMPRLSPPTLFARVGTPPRPQLMGILNVTPDSFSDGGRFLAVEAAVAQARMMAAQGADIIDIGAESTRPYAGAAPVDADTEWRRLADIVPEIVALGLPVSIDSMKAAVAEKALAAGATIVNDVWGLQRDPLMAALVADRGAGLVIMHNRDRPDPELDILQDLEAFFATSLEIADRAGIARERIALDPGIGFGKTPEQSIAVLANLARLSSFGLPLLVGLSRKRFIASVSPSEPHERLAGSIAANALAMLAGASVLRVHDVAETLQAVRVVAAIGKPP